MIQGIKVVTSEEMQRLEKLSFAAGISAEKLMNQAAESLVAIILKWFEFSKAPHEVLLLVGKGNNGGDALAVGSLLLRKKFRVSAILVYPTPELSPLCKTKLKEFQKAGGILQSFPLAQGVSCSLIIDGIVGTGFHGTPDEAMEQAIKWSNAQNITVLAIDLPSGLDGTTGVVESVAIVATMTCYLGLPKMGCFIGQGWNYVGAILACNIGLPSEIVSEAHPTALLLKKESLSLPQLTRTRHKYEAGYVLGIGGSPEMPGAAALSSLATLRSGAGIIRLFTQPETSRSQLASEVICETIDLARIEKEMERADAIFIGPGLGRSSSVQKMIEKLLVCLIKPAVIDGDGLYHLASFSKFSLPAGSVLTPHYGEMKRLLGGEPTLEKCQQWVEKHQITLILKGAPTFLFRKTKHPLIVTVGDPGMATAGSGDVLTGIIASFLAQKMTVDAACALAVYLHGRSGELAAAELSSYSLIASDLISYLPLAFKEVASGTRR